MNYSSYYFEGKRKERLFAEAYISHFRINESDVVYANPQQDRTERWDLKIEGVTYDVKGAKKIKRWDTEYNFDYTWIELRTVDGKAGSAVDGADVKSYEHIDDWFCVRKEDLIRLLFSKIEFQFDDFPVYKLKTRPGRQDVITLVPTEDLRNIAKDFVPKITL